MGVSLLGSSNGVVPGGGAGGTLSRGASIRRSTVTCWVSFTAFTIKIFGATVRRDGRD